jgi:hypothetical protein
VPGGPPRPALSPYLNLLRPSTLPAINYYGLVRPQQQVQASLQSLQAQTTAIGAAAATAADGEQPVVTGVPFGFGNAGFYFQNQFRTGAVGGAPGFGTNLGRSQAAPTGPARPPSRRGGR